MEVTTSKKLWIEINDIKKRLEAVERSAAKIKLAERFSPEEEFKREFPNEKINNKWFSLVGILPQLPPEDDREEIVQAIEEAYRY